ncbi:glycine zipper family protein [Nannocystis bainbridge]|uniref:Glycine zipper family protein n=1 Tax=Nannocystis bainbridge TaxID=2995303 RepID=A0ABT5ED40_9BACT|nr:glycine zipper family protein [Nannocystis bainbridge]MDC0723358.1 glycine zipper family protein [Nannocystis bainbridge]
MDEFIAAIVSFPTVIFTVALLVVVGYWLLALLGGIGSDMLDGAAGKIDGAFDAMGGKVDGALDAMAGKIDGAVDGATGKLEAVGGKIEGAAGGLSLLAAIGFGKAPATVVISMLVLFAWALSTFATLMLGHGVAASAGGGVALAVHVGIAFGAVLLAGMLTGLIAGALGEAFKRHRPIGRGELVGKLATVTTGRVDERFGQANLQEDGANLIIDVRCATPNALVRHTRVVLVSYDAAAHYYMVEPFETKDSLARP